MNTKTRERLRKAMHKHRGSFKAVAAELGVHPSLVSLALRGNHGGRVGQHTEARILEAAQRRVEAI